MHDFEKALEEVKPAFGASTDVLASYCTHGMLPCGETFDHLRETLRALVQQVRKGPWSPRKDRVQNMKH
jgi:vesicle-fusing ATPase